MEKRLSLRRFATGSVRLFLFAALAAGGFNTSATATETSSVEENLKRMPRPWTEPVHRITLEEYKATMDYWAGEYSDRCEIEKVGESVNGLPVYLIKISDFSVEDTDKQVCMVTALHGGPERSGTTSAMHAAEWLLGDSPLAIETRRKQVVLIMPIVNPEAFFETDRFGNAHGIGPYVGGSQDNWDLETLSFTQLDKAPELAAVLSVFDEYRPEVHMDLHGTGLQEYPDDQLGDRTRYQGQTMFEVTGSSYSNFTLRPWDWRVTEKMIEACVELGVGQDRFEADAQQGLWGPVWQPLSGRVWLGRPRFYTAQYAYAKYHTMVSAHEIGWEMSGLARIKGMLEIGNGVWDTEGVSGYPVNRVSAYLGHYVTAHGRTAQARRESRVDLWQKQSEFSHGILYPQTDGRDTYVVAINEESSKLLGSRPHPDEFLDNLEDVPRLDLDAIRSFVEAGPEIMLVSSKGEQAGATHAPRLFYGIGFRLRLPFRNPELLDLRLNGHLLEQSPVDGYQSWYANGFTHVQVNVPPAKAQKNDIYVITCAYVPDQQRVYGWKPPEAVRERLGK